MRHVQKFSSIVFEWKKKIDSLVSLETKVDLSTEGSYWIALIPHSADCCRKVACWWIVDCIGVSPGLHFLDLIINGQCFFKKSRNDYCNSTSAVINGLQFIIQLTIFSYLAVMPWTRSIYSTTYHYPRRNKNKNTTDKVVMKPLVVICILGRLITAFF